MAVNLVSPGIKIREVDLTTGRLDQSNDQIAAFAGPFDKGPVGIPVLIRSEAELLKVFGKPKVENGQNAYWLTASNYLSYGGALQIVRVNSESDNSMNNARACDDPSTKVKIKSTQDYINIAGDSLNTSLNNFWFAAKNPGSWGNDLELHIIDAGADQIISGVNTSAVQVTTFPFEQDVGDVLGSVVGGASSITGISTSGLSIGQVLRSNTTGILTTTTYVVGINSESGVGDLYTDTVYLSNAVSDGFATADAYFDFGVIGIQTTTTGINIEKGYAVSVEISDRTYAGVGNTETFSGYLKGVVTGIGNSSIDIKLIARYSENEEFLGYVDYSENSPLTSIRSGDAITIVDPDTSVPVVSFSSFNVSDWYNNQTFKINNSTVYWKNIAERPSTSQYANTSGGKNDEINMVLIDIKGKVNGNVGEILERHTKLSKAKDAKIVPAQNIYYLDYLRDNSSYLFAGAVPTELEASRFAGDEIDDYSSYSSGTWKSKASGVFFELVGNRTYTLTSGADYNDSTEDYELNLSSIVNAYSVFANPAEYSINYLLSGPSSSNSRYETQAKANYLISIAEARKDCIAVISAHEKDVVNTTNTIEQTNNIVEFFNGITASSYAVLDAGYKYTYDRFNNQFLYLACNSDVAGLMARTSINQYPWFSPAGTSRGVINNAIKLAYNPSEDQRDVLYSNRINPIIAVPGQGIILYGDKTAASAVSAFDRINVRKLFLALEKTIESAARSQLFEFNDAITRSNFINLVDPYLRDVRSKRGITSYTLVCDESNNTPDIIDSNQFVAEIYVQPARSINFIGLTFVATRTGISFSEVVGTV